jgi:hypothetical protein
VFGALTAGDKKKKTTAAAAAAAAAAETDGYALDMHSQCADDDDDVLIMHSAHSVCLLCASRLLEMAAEPPFQQASSPHWTVSESTLR